jgi:predicted nuclease of predicted toxin-antitoxin system
VRIKLDENMPRALAELLRSTSHDVATVPEEDLAGADDPPILQKATSEGRLLMTFDTDFGDVRHYPPGTHAGIVVFRLHDQRWAVLKKPAQAIIESGLLERLHRGIAVVDETRVRIRTSPS